MPDTPLPENLSAVYAHIDQQSDDFIQRLLAYVSRPSISAHGVGIAETADFLLDFLTGLGMESQLLPSAGWPFVFGKRMDQPGAHCLSGRIDAEILCNPL